MRVGQWEAHRGVVEVCRLPRNRGVALLAGLRETPCGVVRIRGALEIFQMAGSAGRAGQVVVVVDMAIEAYAGRIGVCIREREAGACMVEFGVQPRVRPVATFARRGETGGHMVRVGCCLKVVRVARVALGGEPLKLSRGCAFVARFAVNSRVRTDQRKTILMVAYRLHSNSPTLNRVARFAIRTELSAVKVRMAVCTFLTHAREHQFDVALRARHFFMHPAEGVARLVVLKFRDAADRLPTQRCMAVFARNVKRRAVRIARNLFLPSTLRPLSMSLERA
jgi:hypothetical protein